MPRKKKSELSPDVDVDSGVTVTTKSPERKKRKKRKRDEEEIYIPNTLDSTFVKSMAKLIQKEAKILDIDIVYDMTRRVADSLSTGSFALDLITGGGHPPGRRVNFYGKEQSGKSLLSYYGVKSAIENECVVIFYDYEGTTEISRLENIGVKVDWSAELAAGEPVYFWYINDLLTGEQAFLHARRIMKHLPKRKSGKASVLFFVDSIPAMTPRAAEANDESKQTSLLAAMLSKYLPMIKSQLASRRVTWIDTNQLREKPGMAFGNPEYETGGNALKYYGDIRIKCSSIAVSTAIGKGSGRIEEEKSLEGGTDRYNYLKLFTTKNKMFSPYKECLIRSWFEHNGKPLGIIDPFFDVYEYLRLTGQVVKHKRRVLEVNLPGFEGKYQWLKFKEYMFTHKDEIFSVIKEQLNSGEAFDMYSSQISGLAHGVDNDDIDEDEDVTQEDSLDY